jgi:hypothetical protein
MVFKRKGGNAMRKLFLISVVVMSLVITMGVAFGSAADLTVRGGTIQAGMDNDVKMYDIAAVNGWMLETDTGLVSGVRLALIAHVDDFGGDNELEYWVIITGDVGQELTRSYKQIMFPIQPHTDYNLPNEAFIFDTPVLAEDIYDIHVYVEGSANSGPDMGP